MDEPFARTHTVQHETGDHASVVKFIDRLFDLVPLAEFPDEKQAREIGRERYGQPDLGPAGGSLHRSPMPALQHDRGLLDRVA